MKILALDLGKFKTVACSYVDGEHEFITLDTHRDLFANLIRKQRADVVVFESCNAAGWLSDLCEEFDQPFFVANANGEAWRWSKIKRKTDRDDAFKLARLAVMNQLPTVHVPPRATRAKRSLLKFRQSVLSRRVAVQNEIRALWQSQGFAPLPSGHTAWTKSGRDFLRTHTRPLSECPAEEFWRGQLSLLIAALDGKPVA